MDFSQFTPTVYWFLILYPFSKQGHLAKAGVINQYISAIVFFGQGTIFWGIKKSMRHIKCGFFTWVVQADYSSA